MVGPDGRQIELMQELMGPSLHLRLTKFSSLPIFGRDEAWGVGSAQDDGDPHTIDGGPDAGVSVPFAE